MATCMATGLCGILATLY